MSEQVAKSPLPERVRQLREQQNLTQHELSRLCGFGVNQINRIETGIREPSASGLLKISQVLGVSIDYLMGLTDNPHGQVSPSDLNVYERTILETFRREGWAGVARVSVERLSK